jgi:hypothetical protein
MDNQDKITEKLIEYAKAYEEATHHKLCQSGHQKGASPSMIAQRLVDFIHVNIMR